jgi:hypothetical protein
MREFDFDATVEPDHCVTLQFPEDVPAGQYKIHIELDIAGPRDSTETADALLTEVTLVEEGGLLFLNAPFVPGAEVDVVKLIAEARRRNDESKLGMPVR